MSFLYVDSLYTSKEQLGYNNLYVLPISENTNIIKYIIHIYIDNPVYKSLIKYPII